MSSWEEVPDLQLSSVFGNSVVKPQAPFFLPVDAEPQELAEYYLIETLCLSKTELKCVPESIFKNSTLKYLYLKGNQISSIPSPLFISLPNLQWLDLRNNLIPSLPAEIGSHRSLKTLLLEGNPISELPPELGNVITLKGLNLRNCPLSFPPQDIVDQGVQVILQCLRGAMAERQVSTRKAPPELPVVEKLQLSELMGPSMEEQDEVELQKFKELKHKMILLDKAELSPTAQGDGNPKSRLGPITKRGDQAFRISRAVSTGTRELGRATKSKAFCFNLFVRKKATTTADMIPELSLFNSQQWRRPEERRQAAVKERKEKQAILEQGRTQEALQKWHAHAKITQEKKVAEHRQKKNERQRKREEAESDLKPGVWGSSDTPQRQTSSIAITDWEEDRSAQELRRQIRARAEKIEDRRRNPTGTASEQMAAAEQDVEEMTKLQMRLLGRNRSRGRDHGKCFTLFTGDTWLSFTDK
ncbi:leucine-rich repeat-containing protein 27-like isoform X2 [Scophthalmus maximus]|uniref:leucine-rich repeat-containing protein 27-like isoform X2 n=1 Tax=Scophthalmus maximus TaxID=52904 RepID=UPI001FA88E2A|nr:leucine-rich repeat-containing protein 27-like isoform X2 [Scophthalmus maximus]